MGADCCKDKAPQGSINPTTEYQHGVNDHLAPMLQLTNGHNINHRYNSFFKIIRDQKIGTGIKETHAYISKIPQEEIQKQRKIFWETRVEGFKESWQALRKAVDSPEADAVAILSACEIKLVNGSIQLSYDSKNQTYQVPIFCINDPVRFDLPKKDEVNIEKVEEKSLKLKIRAAQIQGDKEVDISNKETVKTLKDAFREKAADFKDHNIRLFFRGKELQDKQFLAETNFPDSEKERIIVQAFLGAPK